MECSGFSGRRVHDGSPPSTRNRQQLGKHVPPRCVVSRAGGYKREVSKILRTSPGRPALPGIGWGRSGPGSLGDSRVCPPFRLLQQHAIVLMRKSVTDVPPQFKNFRDWISVLRTRWLRDRRGDRRRLRRHVPRELRQAPGSDPPLHPRPAGPGTAAGRRTARNRSGPCLRTGPPPACRRQQRRASGPCPG